MSSPSSGYKESGYIRSALQLLVTANVPSSLFIFTLMMEALGSCEISVLTRATRRHIPEDDILRSPPVLFAARSSETPEIFTRLQRVTL
jgi:hypothetical protein